MRFPEPITRELSRCKFLPAARALLAAALVTGCGTDHTAEDYFPLSGDHTWFYAIERTTMDGTTELRHSVSNRPVASPTHDAVRETIDGSRRRYQRRDDGIFRLAEHGSHDALTGTEVKLLPATVVSGANWSAREITTALENSGPPWETLFRIRVPLTMQYRVAELGLSIETPAGRFPDCALIVGHGSTNADVGNYIGRTSIEVATRAWYAPGVGLVRLEREETTTAEAIKVGRIAMELLAWE